MSEKIGQTPEERAVANQALLKDCIACIDKAGDDWIRTHQGETDQSKAVAAHMMVLVLGALFHRLTDELPDNEATLISMSAVVLAHKLKAAAPEAAPVARA